MLLRKSVLALSFNAQQWANTMLMFTGGMNKSKNDITSKKQMLQTNCTCTVLALCIEQKPVVYKWTATAEDHVFGQALVVATRHWAGVDEQTKEGFNSIVLVVSLHQIGARRAFHRTPAEMGCGRKVLTFRQTSLQAQKQERGDLVGVPFGQGAGDIPGPLLCFCSRLHRL